MEGRKEEGGRKIGGREEVRRKAKNEGRIILAYQLIQVKSAQLEHSC